MIRTIIFVQLVTLRKPPRLFVCLILINLCSSCRKGLVGHNWRCECDRVWSNCPVHHPICISDPPVQVDVRPKAEPRAMSAEAAAKRLSRIEPSIAVRPCIGPSLQRRFPQLRDLVSPTFRMPAHETPVFANSSQPPPPLPPALLMVLNTPSL